MEWPIVRHLPHPLQLSGAGWVFQSGNFSHALSHTSCGGVGVIGRELKVCAGGAG